MKAITCAAARRQLQAYYDRELSVSEQIAVAAHVDLCRDCGEALAELRLVSSVLQAVVPARAIGSREEAAGFQAGVMSRAKAERDASFVARVRHMFDDLHLVYAGFGGAAATVVCVAIIFSMMRFASAERPDSLAAMVTFLATPGSSADAVPIDPALQARWTARFQAATETAEQDTVFALASVVTRDGRIANLQRLRSRKATDADAQLIEALMDAVSRARFDPASGEELPAALWLVTHTTVRGNQSTPGVDLVLPAGKKRAGLFGAPRIPAILV